MITSVHPAIGLPLNIQRTLAVSLTAFLTSACGLFEQEVQRAPAASNGGTATQQEFCKSLGTEAEKNARCNQGARANRNPIMSLQGVKENKFSVYPGSTARFDISFINVNKDDTSFYAVEAQLGGLFDKKDRLKEGAAEHLTQYVKITYEEGASFCFYVHPGIPAGTHRLTLTAIGGPSEIETRYLDPSLEIVLEVEKTFGEVQPKTLEEACQKNTGLTTDYTPSSSSRY